MIEIPIGKAIVAVEVDNDKANKCNGCVFSEAVHPFGGYAYIKCISDKIFCINQERKDGKYVIFKLVDYSQAAEFLVDGTPVNNKQSGGWDLK